MRTHTRRSNVHWLFAILVFAAIYLSSCALNRQLRNAELTLSSTVKELPTPVDMEFIGDVPVRAFPSVIDSSECVYAEYFRAYGTGNTSEQALDLYAQQLESLGWLEVSRTEASRLLARGQSETLSLATYPMSGWYVSKLDPNNRRDEFLTVLHLRLFTALPQREGC